MSKNIRLRPTKRDYAGRVNIYHVLRGIGHRERILAEEEKNRWFVTTYK